PTRSAHGQVVARANNSDLCTVRHAELAHDLPDMTFDRTFLHPQAARNNLVRVAPSQEFEDRPLPCCQTAISLRVFQISYSAVVPIPAQEFEARLQPPCWTAISRCVFQYFCSAVIPSISAICSTPGLTIVHDTRRGGDVIVYVVRAFRT